MGQASSSQSSKKGPKVTSNDKAVLQLKLQRDKLLQSQKRLTIVIDKETDIAKQCLVSNPANKSKAKLALRKKKRQETLLTQVEQQTDTIEQLIETIEFKLIEKDVLDGLQMGNKVLKEINNELSVEKVDKILDETAEGVAYQNELSERLSEVLTATEENQVDEELLSLQYELGIIKKSGNHAGEVEDKLNSLPNVSGKIEIENEQKDTSNEMQKHEKNKEKYSQPMLA